CLHFRNNFEANGRYASMAEVLFKHQKKRVQRQPTGQKRPTNFRLT
ncbi:hypothetical protein BSG1_15093, partial [Bacillus sp. SG-1]